MIQSSLTIMNEIDDAERAVLDSSALATWHTELLYCRYPPDAASCPLKPNRQPNIWPSPVRSVFSTRSISATLLSPDLLASILAGGGDCGQQDRSGRAGHQVSSVHCLVLLRDNQ
jgi:hypothetical protein